MSLDGAEPVRIAMWSGPRNISTAMMRSWGARGDCAVTDEPLYGHYLSTLDAEKRSLHPVYQDVIDTQGTDWRVVTEMLTGDIPNGKAVWYQKHMAHHLTEDMDWDWIVKLTNCFLIRDPAAMINSFHKVIKFPTAEDLGLPQQVRLFDWLREQTGTTPPVIDSQDVLSCPVRVMTNLCLSLGVRFDERMLEWEAGPKDEDGVWAPYWYANVNRTTGFGKFTPSDGQVPDYLGGVLDECLVLYDHLARHRVEIY